MTPDVDPAASSAAAERRRAHLDEGLADLEARTSATFPPGWQREAHRWSAEHHRSTADAHTRSAAQHSLESTARRRHRIG